MAENVSSNLINEMYTEEKRLNSFKNWPFNENSKCSAAKMAEAGFFHCPTEIEPDLVQCYVCFKELDGWEANDEPWSEHLSHSKICVFAKINKPQRNLTIGEIFKIECERKINKVKRMNAEKFQVFRAAFQDIEEELASTAFDDISKLAKSKNNKSKKK